MKTFQATPDHLRFFDFCLSDDGGHAILAAVAGAGKTSTLGELSRRLYAAGDPGSVAYTSFARKNVEEAKARFDRRVICSTLHSAGMRAVSAASRRRPKVDGSKLKKALRQHLTQEAYAAHGAAVAKLAGAAKSQGLVPDGLDAAEGLVPDTPEIWADLCARFEIETEDLDRVIAITRRALLAGLRDLSTIDFDDMLYAAVVLNYPLQGFDWLLVDEAQDLSPIQRAMIPRMLTNNGRLVAVGDSRQAIYAWRGADSDALDLIASDFSCTSFPLSTSYRVAKAVEPLAQEIVPHFRCSEGNAEGDVQDLTPGVKAPAFGPTDLVLCRNNAPLVSLAFRLIKARVPCQVLGKDLGKGLLSLIKRLRADSLPDLLTRLAAYEARERAKLLAADREAAVEALVDKCEVLRLFAAETEDLLALVREIERFFAGDEASGKLTLSSIHKAKGGEADVVWILDGHLMPSRYAKSDEARLQEENLRYVAYTRAKRSLRFISSATVLD